MTRLIHGTRHGKVKPYTRVGRRWSETKNAYYDSMKALGYHMFWEAVNCAGGIQQNREAYKSIVKQTSSPKDLIVDPFIQVPFLFALTVECPPVKSGPNKGLPPGNAGDYDNFVKAFLDAAKWAGLIVDDSLRWYRGPARAGTCVHVSDTGWSFHWSFFEAP